MTDTNIQHKLQGIQSELKAPKGQTNKFGGYKYRSCEDILTALKPLLSKWSCTLAISDDIVEVGGSLGWLPMRAAGMSLVIRDVTLSGT